MSKKVETYLYCLHYNIILCDKLIMNHNMSTSRSYNINKALRFSPRIMKKLYYFYEDKSLYDYGNMIKFINDGTFYSNDSKNIMPMVQNKYIIRRLMNMISNFEKDNKLKSLIKSGPFTDLINLIRDLDFILRKEFQKCAVKCVNLIDDGKPVSVEDISPILYILHCMNYKFSSNYLKNEKLIASISFFTPIENTTFIVLIDYFLKFILRKIILISKDFNASGYTIIMPFYQQFVDLINRPFNGHNITYYYTYCCNAKDGPMPITQQIINEIHKFFKYGSNSFGIAKENAINLSLKKPYQKSSFLLNKRKRSEAEEISDEKPTKRLRSHENNKVQNSKVKNKIPDKNNDANNLFTIDISGKKCVMVKENWSAIPIYIPITNVIKSDMLSIKINNHTYVPIREKDVNFYIKV